MKYIIVLGDGMADEPLEELGGKTPLADAHTPMMDELGRMGEVGMVHTIPQGMNPGSDTANLSVLGYDPAIYYSGRSPLEALSIGVPMADTDIAIRCNFVTVSEEESDFAAKTMIDHSADEIATEDCKILLQAVREAFTTEEFQFYTGTSYRHCLIWQEGRAADLTPPHDILTRKIGEYLPKEEPLYRMMEKSHQLLKDHPINIERKKQGLRPANCCWFWGAGTKPRLTSFAEQTGKKGMMVSAVDLLKGIAVGAGMGVAQVAGANGGLHTNYAGKVQAGLDALLKDGYDFAYIHVEAPDEMGHQGSVTRKVQAIEYLDEKVIAPLAAGLKAAGMDYRMLILPDHPTPVRLRTHTDAPVPYLLYDSRCQQENPHPYHEQGAQESGIVVTKGHILIHKLLEK